MTALSRVRTQLFGFPGGPGVATMYFLDTATAVASVRAFWNRCAFMMPLNTHMIVEPNGDIIESTTGTITGAWGALPVAQVDGQANSAYASPVGVHARWETSTILDGRRVRGRTYIVPLGVANYETDGTIVAGSLALLNTAASQLVIEQDTSFVIWHRPREAKPADGSRPAVTARAGSHALVNTGDVSDRVSVLRSRRP